MRAMRADKNQTEIVRALETLGATVQPIRSLRAGCPDLLVGFQGRNFLMEIKVPKVGRLSDAQVEWRDSWKGDKPFVIRTTEEVVRWYNIVRH